MTTRTRSATTAEAAVRTLRLLMTGYQLWGRKSSTEVSALASMLRLSRLELADVMRHLTDEGLVAVDASEHVVLTRAGVDALDLLPPTMMA